MSEEHNLKRYTEAATFNEGAVRRREGDPDGSELDIQKKLAEAKVHEGRTAEPEPKTKIPEPPRPAFAAGKTLLSTLRGL